MENIVRMHCGGKDLILVPTAHVSKESVELVKRVITEERPDSICVELDEGRYESLENPKQWENTDIIKVIKSRKVGFLLANLALSSYQKRMAEKLGTAVGQEMIQGIQSAKETGASLVLADRSIQTTFLRIWRKLGPLEKCKLLLSFVLPADDDDITDEDLQKMLEGDMLEAALSDIRKQFPSIGQVLINERDQFLANKIKSAPGTKVVAILGGAHVPGVSEELAKERDIDVEEINTVPPKGRAGKVIGWAIPAVIVALIVIGFAVNIQTGLQQLSSWILWNSVFAALFTALSLGHPLSILTAFVVAPFSSLNPLFACGWFTGLVEATLRKPTVKDIADVPGDIASFKGFFKNRFLRILLVVVMANVGSTIGTVVAGLDIVRNLNYLF